MSDRDRFSMSELVARTGVTPATVRHYLSLHLLPPPERVAVNRFLYDQRHEQDLRIIRSLRERRHLSLREIRSLLPLLARMPTEQAFRPEMWDEVMSSHSGEECQRTPSTRLLEVGLAAFARHGFTEVSVDDLCQSAHLAKGSFYRHYASKEDLFFAAVEAAGRQAGQALSEAASTREEAEPGAGRETNSAARCVGEPVGLGEEQAAAVLAQAITRHLPLMLDLLSLAAKRRPGHARVARDTFSHIRAVVRASLRASTPPGADMRVVSNAVLLGIGRLLDENHEHEPPPLVLGPGAAGGATSRTGADPTRFMR